jgi:hypothetical protein
VVWNCEEWRVRLRSGVVTRVSLKYLAVEETGAEVLVRLVVGDGSFLLHLAIGRRLILALSHRKVLRQFPQWEMGDQVVARE